MTTRQYDTSGPEYTVAIPVYNSARSLEELCDRIVGVFKGLQKTYEIIMVDDSSRDNSWEVLKGLQEKHESIKIIQLMKNFGQHNALMCAFHHSSGSYIITLDDDLQNPPEEIPKLIEEINKGYDWVAGALEQKQDTLVKKAGSLLIRYLHTRIFNKPKNIKISSMMIMTRALADQLRILKTPYPYISGMLLSLTTNMGNVPVKHEPRKYGRTNYDFAKLVSLAFNLIINYTSLPLRVLTVFGMAVSLVSFCMGLYFIVYKLIIRDVVPGWTSLVVLLSFFNGLLLAILSVMGEYLVRIITEVSNRQQFVIREKRL